MKRPDYRDYIGERPAREYMDDVDAYIDHLEAQDKWVSVEERLPDALLHVLVYYKKNGEEKKYEFAKGYTMPNSKSWILDGHFSWDIGHPTHWRPLPSPPKTEKI